MPKVPEGKTFVVPEDSESIGSAADATGSGISRRAFVKGMGGTAAAVFALGGFSIGSTTYFPVSGGFLQVDHTECAGCTSCMAACSLVHEGNVNLSHSRIQILKDDLAPFPGDIGMFQCRQCEAAPCAAACPTGACFVDEDKENVRRIDRTKCIKCGLCRDACPYTPKCIQYQPDGKDPSAPVLATGTAQLQSNVMQKCDLCANAPFWNRKSGPGVEKGQACVAVCPAQAIRFVTDPPALDEYDVQFYDQRPNRRGWGRSKA